jgi:hypothetical protein
MNDFNDGLVEGVMIALLIAERHKRTPKQIQAELVKNRPVHSGALG